jgi:glycosyltransferase involved in cell wall biosynthesis
MKTTIAVIIPSFNRRDMLARALRSVLVQTRAADEVCVVDDGSTDGTGDYVRENFPMVQYLYQSNQGVSAARNVGVQATQSHWLSFLDSDDEWLEGKLSAQLEALQSNTQYRLVHGDEIWIRRGVRVNPGHRHAKAGGNIFQQCLSACTIAPSAVMLERSLFSEMGGFDESLPACEDYDLWLRICSRYPVLYLDQFLLRRHGGHADQLSRRYWGMDRFRLKALDSLLRHEHLSSSQRRAAQASLIEKCEILINGARKRDNEELLVGCLAIRDKYRQELEGV